MIESTKGDRNPRTAAIFAYAAGVLGILSNLFLVLFFTLQASNPEDGTWLGSANDLVGSLGTAFMIPVALVLSAWLPDRRLSRVVQVLGVSAMAVLVVGGPLLVLGVLEFEVQVWIVMGAGMVLYLWLILVNRWLRSSGALPPRMARFGESLGSVILAAGAVAGLGLLLPWTSRPQMILFGTGAVLATIGILGTPFWFVLLGQHFGRLKRM